MTSQRLVEDFARWLWKRDEEAAGRYLATLGERVPDSYLNEAAVFLAGELGQRLQRGEDRQLSRRDFEDLGLGKSWRDARRAEFERQAQLRADGAS